MSILLKNCRVLSTVDGRFKLIKNAFLGVEGQYIDYIGEEKPEKCYDSEKNLRDAVVIPGLINCHSHSPMVLLRGVGSDLPLQQWLFDKCVPVEDRMTHEDFLAGMELAQLEMLACGTTSYTEMYMDPVAECELSIRSGMKINATRVMQCFDKNDRYESSLRAQEQRDLFRKYHGAADGRVMVDYSIHAEYTCLPHMIPPFAEECRANGGRFHIHMSETRREHEECIARHGKTPAEFFNALGVFDSPTAAAHCVWVSDSDMQLMRDKGVSVIHNPSSNMKLGSGYAPINKMMNMGINVTLGTDGAASNNNLNMFEEMHMASLIHNGYHLDPVINDPAQVLKMATINGAKLQGRGDTGSLEVGKKADLAVVSLDKPHMRPCLDEMALLCYSAQGSDVVMTMVDGKVLYENGEYKTLDAERIYYDVNKAIRRLY